MMKDNSYAAIMARKNEIIRNSVGMDYESFEKPGIGFDYEAMMAATGYTLPELQRVQALFSVGNTPLIELRNLTALARKCAPAGKGARIFIKDEATNPSGSFKARRSCTSVYQAKKLGYKGVVTATSGNYGAAVACHAAMAGLKCIVVQECYDSRGVGQPEIIEKARKCEALGAEVVQLTVGPELFSTVLRLLEETGYFNASLYTPFGIAGVETLGYEIAQQFRAKFDRDPDVVVCTNAGGGNLTGTARGLRKADCHAKVIGASVNLTGLHMASDAQFNKKSFTTGHTGFGVPFCVNPDRSDVPRSAARPLRYMDRYVTVSQGSVFFITETLASLEGLERDPQATPLLQQHSVLHRKWMKISASLCRRPNTPAQASISIPSFRLQGRTASTSTSATPRMRYPAKTSFCPHIRALSGLMTLTLTAFAGPISRMPSERTRMSLPMTTFATLLKKPTAAKNLSAAL